jgi:hypothetical protein
MLSYHEVLLQLLLINNHKAIVVIAPLELTLRFYLAYMVPPCSPLPRVVVHMKT